MTPSSDAPALQFTKAEYDGTASAASCGGCQTALGESYFDVDGQALCPGCTQQVREAQSVNPGVTGILKATGAGIAAGVLGAALYYAVLAVTGYEFGLLAIVVGWLVGRAVRWGSVGRGGRSYQAIAVVLTYLAIVSCYVPFMIEGPEPREAATQASVADGTGAAARTADVPPATVSEAPLSASQVAVALAIFIAVVLASPFLAGFSNIIGWLIIGFALFEAWKINRRLDVEISGPFQMAPAGDAPAVPPVPAPSS